MNGTMVTLVGHVISEVRYATTAGGVPVASFRLAATDRRFDRQRQMWVEGDTSFFTVWSWRWLAENVLGSVGRGDPLLLTGRMRVREWDNGEGNPRGVAAEIEATAIGHDLSRGTSAFRRASRGRTELVARASSRAVDDGTGPERPDRSAAATGEQERAGAPVVDPAPVPGAGPGPGPASGPVPGPGTRPVPVLVGATAGRGEACGDGQEDGRPASRRDSHRDGPGAGADGRAEDGG